jgi:glycogen(starch) synthase
MKIALISYEYPPDTANGGIATYVFQAARMLAERGNAVEVFAGSLSRNSTEFESGIVVHRFIVKDQINFAGAIVKKFVERHELHPFDIIEGPDYKADARGIVAACPQIPYVLKLHTPTAVLWQIEKPSLFHLAKVKLKELLHGINPFTDYECEHALRADLITSPSYALSNMLIKLWGLKKDKVSVFPYPYVPAAKLVGIPVETSPDVVTFLGRLELRKGVIELADAIPIILAKFPKAKFRLVGENRNSPERGVDMKQYLIKRLGSAVDSVEFIEKVSLDQIPQVFAQTGIAVFPSRFENFGLVCLEAMAAGRAIVASNNGGMSQMLDSDKLGRLIPPNDPESLARAVIELLADPAKRMSLGAAARNKILTEYTIDNIGIIQENAYRQAINNRRLSQKKDPINPAVLT